MPDKKLNKNAADKPVSPEQALINSAITQAGALVEIANCLSDIANTQETLLELEAKRALKEGLISPDEYEDYLDDSDEIIGDED